MQIVHILNHFFYTIFPSMEGKSKDDLIHALEVYYSYGPYKPKVTVNDELVVIVLDKDKVLGQEADYRMVLAFCDSGNYTEAKPLLCKLQEFFTKTMQTDLTYLSHLTLNAKKKLGL